MVTMALYTLSHADFDHYYKLYCTASGLSLPEGWHFTLGGPHKVTIDLYQLYQAVVLRGGIAYDASDPEWRGLAQASMIASTSATAMPTPVAMRSIYQGRIRGFLDFMADLVRQYNAARKEAGIKEEEDDDDDDDFYYGAGAGYTVGRGRAVRRPHAMRGGAARSGARAGGGHSRSGQRPPGAARAQHHTQRSPAPDVPDPVPGDRLRSMATWLRGAVLGFAEKPYAEVTSTNSALGRRYRSAFARLTAARTAELPHALFPLFGARASVPAPRRSGRTRAQRTARGSSEDEDQGSGSEGEAEIGVIRVGRYAQAVLPEWHPMPPPAEGATQSEARRLEAAPLYSPDQAEGRGSGGDAGGSGAAEPPTRSARGGAGGAADAGGGGSKVQQVERAGRALAKGRGGLQTSYAEFAEAMAELGSEQQRQDLLRGALAQLDEEIGPGLVQRLGLTELGCKLRADWTESDEALFALGMLWFRRPNKSVQRKYLPHKTLHQLQSYYYNVWKLRGTQLADLYYEMEPYVRKTATDRRLERSEAEKRAEVYEARVLQLLAVAQLNVKTEQGQPPPPLPAPAAGSKRGAGGGGGSGGGSAAADRPGSGGGAAAKAAAAAAAGPDAFPAAAAAQPAAAAVGAQPPAGSSKRPSSAADNDSGSKGGEVASKRAKTAAAAAAAAAAVDGAGLAAAATPATAGGSRPTRLTLKKSDPGAAAATPAANGKGVAAATADAAADPAPDSGAAAAATSGRRSRSSAAAATPSAAPAAAAAAGPGSAQPAAVGAAADPRRSYSGSYSKLNDWDVKAASKLTRAQMAANERRALRKALSFVLLAARDPSGLPPRYNLAVQLPRLQRMRDLQISQAPEEWQAELAGATEQGATAAPAAAGTASGGAATRGRGAAGGSGSGTGAGEAGTGTPAASRAQPTRSSKRQRQ